MKADFGRESAILWDSLARLEIADGKISPETLEKFRSVYEGGLNALDDNEVEVDLLKRLYEDSLCSIFASAEAQNDVNAACLIATMIDNLENE